MLFSVIDEGESTTAEMVARFVSKIPIVDGSMLFPGLFDVWLTADVRAYYTLNIFKIVNPVVEIIVFKIYLKICYILIC